MLRILAGGTIPLVSTGQQDRKRMLNPTMQPGYSFMPIRQEIRAYDVP